MADVTFEKFGGLNLISDPQEAGAEQAISCFNVTLDRNGRLRSRDGYSAIYTSAHAAYPLAMHAVTGSIILVAFDGTAVRAVDVSAGTSSGSVSLGPRASAFASAGTSGTAYFTNGTTGQVGKYVGGVFSTPAGLSAYEGNYLAVQPLDDRLVIADANSTSKLWFSDAATPETINVSNFVEVSPGDGEPITGMVVYGTELFVFKRTKFFVFYGNATDSTGGVIFNYRMVDTGVGCIGTDSLTLAAAHETGVYFVGRDGVYRTTGGPPVKVSGDIDPIFKGTNLPIPAPFSSLLAEPLDGFFNLDVAGDHLYLFGTLGVDPAQFVLDLRTGAWTVYLLVAGSMLDGDLVGRYGEILVGIKGTTGVIAGMGRAYATDAGAVFPWQYQSGFYDLGSQHTKRTRRTALWGSGSPTLSIFTDHGSTDANALPVTLGTAPAVARGWHSKAYRGVLFSHRVSGTSAATVHRLGHSVADERQGQ